MVGGEGLRDHRGIAEFTETGTDIPPSAACRRGEEGRAPDEPGPTPGPSGRWHVPPWERERLRHGRRNSRRFHGPFRRSSDSRVLAGVCGGLSASFGIDVTLVRIAFVLLTLGSGVGLLVYALAWLLVPLEGETTNIFSRALSDRRGLRLVIALVPAVIVVEVVARATVHSGYVATFAWPLFIAAAVAILIRRNASETERVWINEDLLPMLQAGEVRRSRWSLVARVAVGILLAAAGLSLLVLGHKSAAVLRPVIGSLLVIAALVVVFGPWWLSLLRDLMAERQARALAEERAQMAAHIHDSVLQTLALIQRSADDPQNVVRLARAQERELRSWLFEGKPPGRIGEEVRTLDDGIRLLQRRVEADHGIAVQTVVVGDCPLDDALRSLLQAAGEAAVNSAKWSGAPEVAVYAEVEPGAVRVYVRDRGEGFDPESVPADRQGIAQSIRARMARCGGSVTIRSSPGNGAEVQLSVPRRVTAG